MSFSFKVFLYLNQTFSYWIQGSFCSKHTSFEKNIVGLAQKLSKFHLNVINVIENIYNFLSLSWIIFNQYYHHSPHVASVHLLACKFYGFDNLHVGFFIFVIYYLPILSVVYAMPWCMILLCENWCFECTSNKMCFTSR